MTHLLQPIDTAILDRIVRFVKGAPTRTDQGRLPTGLIASGPKVGFQTRLLERWPKKTAMVFSLHSAQTPNLMTALKNFIRAAIIHLDGMDGYQTFLNGHKRKIPMNYDLRLLQEFMASRNLHTCVLYLTDIEAFDIGLLTDLISVLHDWRDRIPVVLLLGISTTVDLLEARLAKSTIRLLDCKLFDVSIGAYPCLEVYRCLHSQSNSLAPSLGPVASGALLHMSREQDESAANFSRATKYAIMSHFFANALSILLKPASEVVDASRELCEAIRRNDSFRTYAEQKLSEGEAKRVREMLDNDTFLLGLAEQAVRDGQEAMSRHHLAIEVFEAVLNSCNNSETPSDPFTIRVHALSDSSFLDSALYTELIAKITSLPSDQMRRMLDALQQHNKSPELDINPLLKKLDRVAPTGAKAPLRSAYDPNRTTTSTTITNNRVALSKHGLKLSVEETEYTHLVDEILSALSSYFENNICNPTTLFMHEAFVYDLKSPLATAFAPRPRYATERALSMPTDYLGCECCEGQATGQISATQPPTSILWRLWCEAGGVVNVRDLWNAFSAIVVGGKQDDDGGEADGHVNSEREEEKEEAEEAPLTGAVGERMALALFYKGLAEMRLMGFVKGTKRKTDCLAKTAWKGL